MMTQLFFRSRYINSPKIAIISDSPQVTLSLGSTLNPDDIKEGDDVYFECHIKANPKEHRITWSHDVCFNFHILYLFHNHQHWYITHIYMHICTSNF